MEQIAWPNVDPRVHAVGVSKLRQMTATFLRKLGEDIYILQDNDVPLAVMVSYGEYLALQQMAKEATQ